MTTPPRWPIILIALVPVLLSACASMAPQDPLQVATAGIASRVIILVITHMLAAGVGFAVGIYELPILTAPRSPSKDEVMAQAAGATYKAEFRRDLKGSDLLHWGKGAVTVGPKSITFMGKMAPGPSYKLYLSPEFVETEADFERVRSRMVRVGDVKTFEMFVLPLPETVDLTQYNTVVVWCESFSQFITAAQYR